MVFVPDQQSQERQEKLTRRGLVQAVIVVIGLALLLILFRPTTLTLILSLTLALIGGWAGFTEARSGRLEMVVPASKHVAPSFRRLLPGLTLIGFVLGALLVRQWLVAIGDILFFLAGVLFGIGLSNATESRPGA